MKDSQSLPKKPKKFIRKTVKPVVSSKTETLPIVPQSLEIKAAFFSNLKKSLLLLLIPISLFVIFLILTLINNYYLGKIVEEQPKAFPADIKINPYPFIQEAPLLSITAKSAIILDTDSQVVVFSKNPSLPLSMASTTKIMTALTALDFFQNNSILTVKSFGVEGTGLGFIPGQQFYFEDLLYAMLLPSANDAAQAVADNYPGGASVFVTKMNEKAAGFHLSTMHFVDPTGLEDTGDYTTVADLARLASIAIQNKEFADVVGTKQKIITTVNKLNQFNLNNLNKLLGIDGVTGIKTGTTEGAGEVLVTSVVNKGHTFIIVVMNSTDRFTDTEVLINFINQKVQFISPTHF
ncbi:D-alanyl-D-alanine carboxypeptidase [Candidatus Roizmanbacteria bacterium]|nr:D-alanyl-D-alanine carboxypeptidase [Candidatus Roizmanbacteria bacterium]